jgi:hypothetical protein
MLALFMECLAKIGNADEVSNRVVAEILPILQEQLSFIDFIVLTDKEMPERLLCISVLNSMDDRDKYHREQYDTVAKVLRPILAMPPSLETFNITASTAHRLGLRGAA